MVWNIWGLKGIKPQFFYVVPSIVPNIVTTDKTVSPTVSVKSTSHHEQESFRQSCCASSTMH